jgi:triacylglycerol lipase
MNIVLVHGILGSTAKFGIEYFQGVADHFREKGVRVLVPQLDPTRGVEFRGDQLRDQIASGYGDGRLNQNETTHIVAHSLGGLDSRYMLSPQNPNGTKVPIRSLTTIATPHRGAPIADLLESPAALSSFPLFGAIGDRIRSAFNAIGISLDALHDLTSDSCLKFEKYANNPDVFTFQLPGVGGIAFPIRPPSSFCPTRTF